MGSEMCIRDRDISLNDLKEFLKYGNHKIQKESLSKILVFPPLNPRGRYLIHTCAGVFNLASKSIGKDTNSRRVTVFTVFSVLATKGYHQSVAKSCYLKSENLIKKEYNSKSKFNSIMSSPR